MDQQIRPGDLNLVKSPESNSLGESQLTLNGEEGNTSDLELHPDINSEFSDAATLEQRRAYKAELQVVIICLLWMTNCYRVILLNIILHRIEKQLLDFTRKTYLCCVCQLLLFLISPHAPIMNSIHA